MKLVLFLFVICFPSFAIAQAKTDSSLTFPYEKQCGKRGMESDFYIEIGGRVTQVEVADTISSVGFDNGEQRKVILAGVAPFADKQIETRQMLVDLLVGQQITIEVNPSKMDEKEFAGVIRLKDEDVSLKWIRKSRQNLNSF